MWFPRFQRENWLECVVMAETFITFPGSTDGEANQLAGALQRRLVEADREISVRRERQNPHSQDGGATLAIILGSAAVTSVAKGIASWIARNAGTTIRIHSPDGTWVDVRNATGQDTAEIVGAALRKGSSAT